MLKFKKLANPIGVSDPWYDLTDGGYIKPEKLLADKADIAKVKDAIRVVKDFLQEAEEAGVIEMM